MGAANGGSAKYKGGGVLNKEHKECIKVKNIFGITLTKRLGSFHERGAGFGEPEKCGQFLDAFPSIVLSAGFVLKWTLEPPAGSLCE